DILIGDVDAVAGTKIIAPPVHREEPIEVDGLLLDVFDLDPNGAVSVSALGTAEPLASGTFTDTHSVSLGGSSPALAIGVGAFGESFADCRARFGELISVAGATACQPADGTNVADYLVARGPIGSGVRLLYGLACEGAFSHLVRFDAPHAGAAVTPSRLA